MGLFEDLGGPGSLSNKSATSGGLFGKKQNLGSGDGIANVITDDSGGGAPGNSPFASLIRDEREDPGLPEDPPDPDTGDDGLGDDAGDTGTGDVPPDWYTNPPPWLTGSKGK